MSDNSAIEWTDATWNPTVGCTKVSAGCDHCYAETLVNRFAGSNSGFPNRFDVMTLRGEATLSLPLRWRKPKRIFVNSLSDLFHAEVPDEFIARVFVVMAMARQHTFQVLTKRHGRMRALLSSPEFQVLAGRAAFDLIQQEKRPVGWQWPLPNVWLGVSVESQQWADIRIPALLDTPAAIRFLSCEPLLGPVRLAPWLTRLHDCDTCEGSGSVDVPGGGSQCPDCGFDARAGRLDGIDWVIVGGESGPGARPMLLPWALSLRDQCVAAGVPFLFKQYGAWVPTKTLSVGHLSDARELHGEQVVDDCHPDITWRRLYRRVGKKAAGREMDGRTWDEFPAVPA